MMLFGTENGWTNLNLDQCVSHGILLDLNPYLAEDPVLRAEDLVPNVYENMQQRGGLYAATYGFRIRTLYARADLGAKENWTLEEFVEIAGALPDGVLISESTQSGFLTEMLEWCLPVFCLFGERHLRF